MEITKIEPRTYTYELVPSEDDEEYASCMWARFIFDCDNGILNINSDVGYFSYEWECNKYEDFMHLMGRIDKWNLLDKLSRRSKFLIDESKKYTIKTIEDAGWVRYGIESEEEWEVLKKKILKIYRYSSEDYFCRTVFTIIPYMNAASIRIEKDYPDAAKVIVNLFEKYMQPKIKEEFKR